MANIYDQARDYVQQEFDNISPKNGKTALILCVLFGGFGAHRFYVGKKLSGLVYLFTGGGFIVGMIFDLLCLIIGKFKDSQGRTVYINPQAAYDYKMSSVDQNQAKAEVDELYVLRAKVASLENAGVSTEQKIEVLKAFVDEAEHQSTIEAAQDVIRMLEEELEQ